MSLLERSSVHARGVALDIVCILRNIISPQRKRDNDWLQSTAHAMELELDQDWYGMGTDKPTSQELDKEEELKCERTTF